MAQERIIFHIDVNSAFLSWESVYRLSRDPSAQDLREIPSAVGGDQASRRGVVSRQKVRCDHRGTPDPGFEKMPSAGGGPFPV